LKQLGRLEQSDVATEPLAATSVAVPGDGSWEYFVLAWLNESTTVVGYRV
jgi:hypothetical protein